MRRRLLFLPLAAGLAFLTGCDWDDFCGAGSARYSEDFHHRYPLKPGGRLTLENFNGSVEISGWDQATVDISGAKYAHTPEMRDAIKIEITPSADSIYVRTVRPSERRGNMGARYVVKVPRRIELERIVSSNGTIRVTDVEGAARLKTSNGSVRAMHLAGNLEAQTSNGAIEVENLEGSASLRTSNGRVRAEGVQGALDASTSNGGISARIRKPDPSRPIKLGTSNGGVDLTLEAPLTSDVHATTSNGGITVHLPGSLAARVRAHTSNASISTDFEVKTQGALSKHHLEGAIGSGGPLLDLSTSNGSIRLLRL